MKAYASARPLSKARYDRWSSELGTKAAPSYGRFRPPSLLGMIDTMKTFDLDACSDMLRKLRRERERIARSSSRTERADHATNAMITAWQMKDWVLVDAARDAPTHAAISSLCASSVGGTFNEKNFTKFLYKECPALEYCFLIATNSKHSAIFPQFDNPSVATTASLTAATSISLGDLGSTETGWEADRWVFKIVHSGVRKTDLEIVDEVIGYWSKFLLKHGIG